MFSNTTKVGWGSSWYFFCKESPLQRHQEFCLWIVQSFPRTIIWLNAPKFTKSWNWRPRSVCGGECSVKLQALHCLCFCLFWFRFWITFRTNISTWFTASSGSWTLTTIWSSASVICLNMQMVLFHRSWLIVYSPDVWPGN